MVQPMELVVKVRCMSTIMKKMSQHFNLWTLHDLNDLCTINLKEDKCKYVKEDLSVHIFSVSLSSQRSVEIVRRERRGN